MNIYEIRENVERLQHILAILANKLTIKYENFELKDPNYDNWLDTLQCDIEKATVYLKHCNGILNFLTDDEIVHLNLLIDDYKQNGE